MSVDPRSFRQSLGSFASGVTVVTTVDPVSKTPQGVTVSAFSSVSLDPPLVLFCLGKNTASLEAFKQSLSFGVNVLGAEQEEISNRFAARGTDKWAGLDWDQGYDGVPLLQRCATNLECKVVQIVEGGDHLVFIGEVQNLSVNEDIKPLLYFRGAYHRL